MMPSKIDHDKAIYRFLNFFELFRLVKDKQLRFTKLHKLDDKNEGVGKILRSLELSPVFRINLNKLRPIIMHTTYVSCWTDKPKNIALWYQYSPNNSGIRLKTTVSKLYAAINNYEKEHSDNACEIEDFQPNHIDVFKMKYDNLKKTREAIDLRIKMADAEWKKLSEGKSNADELRGKSTADKLRGKAKVARKYLEDCILKSDGFEYKNKYFFYENEVRGQIIFTPTNETAYDDMYSSECDFSKFPDFIFPTINDDFIEELCFDPRCRPYKIEVFKKIIDPDEAINIIESNAFEAVF